VSGRTCAVCQYSSLPSRLRAADSKWAADHWRGPADRERSGSSSNQYLARLDPPASSQSGNCFQEAGDARHGEVYVGSQINRSARQSAVPAQDRRSAHRRSISLAPVGLLGAASSFRQPFTRPDGCCCAPFHRENGRQASGRPSRWPIRSVRPALSGKQRAQVGFLLQLTFSLSNILSRRTTGP
jgi:hypothetical protein